MQQSMIDDQVSVKTSQADYSSSSAEDVYT